MEDDNVHSGFTLVGQCVLKAQFTVLCTYANTLLCYVAVQLFIKPLLFITVSLKQIVNLRIFFFFEPFLLVSANEIGPFACYIVGSCVLLSKTSFFAFSCLALL